MLPVLLLQSCLHDEENLFSQSPSERVEAAIKEYREVLTSSENGWLLEYYPEKNQKYGGYAYILKFDKDNVTAYFEWANKLGKDPEKETVSSLYNILPTQGALLSFDAYNEFIHYFANPSSSAYQGKEGDYEFVLKSISEDKNEITVKGSRTGNEMKLRRMTESPETYIANIRQEFLKLRSNSVLMHIANTDISARIKNRVLSFRYMTEGPMGEMTTANLGYCFTELGIKLYKPFTLNGVTFQEFKIVDNEMVSLDGNVRMEFVREPPYMLFLDGNWFFKYSELGSVAKAQWNNAKAILDRSNKTLEFASIGYLLRDDAFCFNFQISGVQGAFVIGTKELPNEQIALSLTGSYYGGSSALAYWSDGTLKALMGAFAELGPEHVFTVTTDNPVDPEWMQLTEVGNPGNVIKLFTEDVLYPYDN
jgi:hypothetical protein